MNIQEICAIGKIEANDENIAIIQNYIQYIKPWLNSTEFKQNWANKPYPPLIDPKKIDFEGANALHAWTLNIPFPKYYDFVVFGSHGVGITTAMNGYLWLCGAVAVGLRRDANGLVKLLAPNMMDKLRAYIKALIKAMNAVFDEHYKYRFSENDVLEYFKANPKSRQVFSYVLNQHLTLLRTHKPEIIKSYEWYQKYLEIAKNDEPLDTTQNGVSVTNF